MIQSHLSSRIFLFFLLIFSSLGSQAANYFWVGGTGNWSQFGSHWATSSGGSTFQSTLFFEGIGGEWMLADNLATTLYPYHFHGTLHTANHSLNIIGGSNNVFNVLKANSVFSVQSPGSSFTTATNISNNTGWTFAACPPPTITCVSNKVRNANNTLCTYMAVGAEFNPSSSSAGTLAWQQTGATVGSGNTTLAGILFQKGTTTVTWTVTDANSNTATCQFNVTVNDTQLPTISCIGNQTKSMNTGQCSYAVAGSEFNPASFDDNCPGATISYSATGAGVSPPTGSSLAGAVFQPGLTILIWKVTDATGTTRTCTFAVDVIGSSPTTLIDPIAGTVCGATDYLLGTTTSGANFPHSFAWTGPGAAFLNDATSDFPVFNGPAGNYSLVFTATDADGCSASDQLTLNVAPPPSATFTVDNTAACENGTSSIITFTGSDGTMPYLFGYQINNGPTNYLTSTGPTASINVPTNTPGSFSYNLVSVEESNGCTASLSLPPISILVNVLPEVTLAGPTNVCQGSTISLTGSPSGGTFSSSGGAATVDANGVVSGISAGISTILYQFADGNGCSASDSKMITVNASPTVSLANFSPVCTNATAFTLTGGLPIGGTYSGNGVSGGQFNPANAGAGSHVITYLFIDGNGCSNSATNTILVNALPTVSLAAQPSVCLSAAAFPLSGGLPAGGTFSGGPAVNAGIFSPSIAGPGSHSILYSFTDGNGCTNSDSKILTVFPLTVGGSVSPAQTICSGATPFNLTLQNQVGAILKWQSSPNGAVPWTDIASTANPFQPGPLTATTHFRAVVQSGNCLILNSNSAKITANPLPTVSFTLPATVCQNGGLIPLVGSPSGGTWSGLGITGTNLNPAVGITGPRTITYTKAVGGCTGTASETINVLALPPVSLANLAAVCLNSAAFSLTGGLPTGGVYAGLGVTGGSLFTPASAGVGTHTISYTVTDAVTGCTKSTTKTLKVNALPVVGLAPISTVCTTTPPFSLSGGLPTGGDYDGPGVSPADVFSAVNAGPGIHLISYTVTNGTTGCTNSATQNIVVSGSCSITCTIITCPPARNVNLSASSSVAANSCKLTIPNLLPEVVLAGDCELPIFSKTQNPAAGDKVSAVHDVPVNVVITVIDLAGNTVSCTVVLIPKDVSGPTFSNIACPATSPANLPTFPINTSCQAVVTNLIPYFALQTTDCSTIVSIVQSPVAGNMAAVHGQIIPMTFTATDVWGNQSVCVKNYKAKDATRPAATCPTANQNIALDGNCQFIVPDFTGIAATDCTAPITKTQVPAAGTVITSTNGQVHAVVLTITDGVTPTTPNNSKNCPINLTGVGGSCLVGGGGGNAFKLTNANPQASTNADFQAMPNPFSDELTVVFDLETAGNTRLVLMDLTGQFQFLEKENWLERGRQKVVFNTEDLPAGAFFVGLKTENSGWIWRKVVLVR